MKKGIIILKVFTYGLLIPLFVLLLAELCIELPYYFFCFAKTEDYSLIRFEVIYYLWSKYTIIYYVFCTLFFFIKKPTIRKWLFAIFLTTPIIFYTLLKFTYHLSARFDINFTMSIYNLIYYGLFLMSRYFYKLQQKEIRK